MALNIAIIGAGASGLYAAKVLAESGYAVSVFESRGEPGRKLSVCGGGAGNITNDLIDPLRDYISQNPRFALSALKAFDIRAFLAYLNSKGLKTCLRGTARFLDGRARDLTAVLFDDARNAGAKFYFNTPVCALSHTNNSYTLTLKDERRISFDVLILCCGGKSYPDLSGSDAGLTLAAQLGLNSVPCLPALAPLLFPNDLRVRFGELSGIALQNVVISCAKRAFRGSLVFRPDGIGGLAVFKTSLIYAHEHAHIHINFLPDQSITAFLQNERIQGGTRQLKTVLSLLFPKRLATALIPDQVLAEKQLSRLTRQDYSTLEHAIGDFEFEPARLASWKEAEVMYGGLDTNQFSSRSLEAKILPNLYVCGELLDVTGELGGYNLHWAFASAHAVTQAIAQKFLR